MHQLLGLSSACWPHIKLTWLQCFLISCYRTWASFFGRWHHQTKSTRRTTFLLFPVVENLRGLTSHFQAKSVTQCFLSQCHKPRALHAMLHCKWCLTQWCLYRLTAGALSTELPRGAVRALQPLRQQFCFYGARGSIWVYPSEIHTNFFINGKN